MWGIWVKYECSCLAVIRKGVLPFFLELLKRNQLSDWFYVCMLRLASLDHSLLSQSICIFLIVMQFVVSFAGALDGFRGVDGSSVK